MPLSRCDTPTHDYRCRSHDPPEAVLEGRAMAALVAILRQLGDLAGLAAEVFQDLQDQVMAASARGRRLAVRAKQLEADLPPIDRDDLDFFSHKHRERCMYAAACNTDRVTWHADLKVSHGVVAGGDMPYFITEFIDRCRGPPRLSMLDKFDADGEGACLRRYTNPSFFSTNSAKLQEGNLAAEGYLKTTETRQKFQSAENFKPPNSAHTDYKSKTETDTSEKTSPGFLSMLRQLKHRQTNGSVFLSLRPQLQQNIQKYESSPEEKYSSVDHSEIDISFTSSSDCNINITEDASTSIVKAKDNHQSTVQFKDSPATYYSSDVAGSDNRGNCNELERTSSFEAWLSPDARFTPEHGVIEEASHDTSEVCVSDAITSNAALSGAITSKQNSNNAAEISYKKGVSKRSKYKGSVEMIASRVSSFPRKLFMKQQHDPVTDSSPNMTKKALEPAQAAAPTDTDSARSWRSNGDVLLSNGDWCSLDATCPSFREQLFLRASDVPSSPDTGEAYRPYSSDAGTVASITSFKPEAIPKMAFPPALVTNPAFGRVDSAVENQQRSLDHENTTGRQSTRAPSYDSSVSAEIHYRQNSPSISNHCSGPENNEQSSSTPDSEKLSPTMESSVCMINGSLHEPTTVLPENSCSEDTRAVIPALPPIPPMQWLSVKVHTGPEAASPKLRTLRTRSPEVNHDDRSPSLQSVKPQKAEMIQARSQQSRSNWTSQTKMARAFVCNEKANANVSPRDGICKDSLMNKKYIEIIRQESFRKGTPSDGKSLKTVEFRRRTLLSNEACSELAEINTQPQAETHLQEECSSNLHNSPARRSHEDCSSNLHKENVFFAAVEQLEKMSPPSVPRPKYSLLEVASQDRISLRNGPSLIHPSRNIMDNRSVLLEQIKDKSFSLKPVSGMSSTVIGSPTNSRVATILQRADDIRQAHVDDNDVGSEDNWSDSV